MWEIGTFIGNIFSMFGTFSQLAFDTLDAIFDFLGTSFDVLRLAVAIVPPPFNALFLSFITLTIGFTAYKLLRGV